MTTITVHAKPGEDLYKLLINKEYELRKKKRGSFVRRSGKSRKEQDIWKHKRYPGWVRFRNGLNGSISVVVQSKAAGEDWQILDAFVSFLYRYFSSQMASMTMTFGE
jgi:hypothetical protein